MAWEVIWMTLVTSLISATAGYVLGISRDRRTAIRAKQIAAMTQLHERVLEIESRELSDGKSMTLWVSVQGGTKKRTDLLSDDEVEYQSQLNRWREELREEENRARLWVNERTAHVVSAYFLTMMQCSGWEEFGKGRLTEDAEFIGRLRFIFGAKVTGVLNAIVRRKSDTGEPWLVDCVGLSDRCLGVIQRRVYREVASPFFCVVRLVEAVSGRTWA